MDLLKLFTLLNIIKNKCQEKKTLLARFLLVTVKDQQ